MANEPELRSGDTGDWVVYLQQCLQTRGFWPYDADGNFGPEVEQAVVQIQEAWALSADGVVEAKTWAVLTGENDQSGDPGQGDPAEPGATETEELPEMSEAEFLEWLGIPELETMSDEQVYMETGMVGDCWTKGVRVAASWATVTGSCTGAVLTWLAAPETLGVTALPAWLLTTICVTAAAALVATSWEFGQCLAESGDKERGDKVMQQAQHMQAKLAQVPGE